MTDYVLMDQLAALSPARWREILLAAAMQRCIACGLHDGCDCDDLTDAAKNRVKRRAAEMDNG